MLITIFLNLVYSIVVGFLSLFPDATPDTLANISNITTAVGTASTYLSSVSAFAPVTTILTIVGLFLTIEGVILLIKIINWLIRKIPTIS